MPQSQSSLLIVAGEASADLHGAKVVAALRRLRPDVEVFGIGGAAMREQGMQPVARAEEIAVAGLTEVLLAVPRIWGIMRRLVAAARQRRPGVAVLIDLPDFNLRLARRLKQLGIPVVYYISPQVWAWRPGRVKQIREVVSEMLVVLPFEQQFYEQHGVAARFVGHPLIDDLPQALDRDAARSELGLTAGRGPVVALLPGSRHKEITRHLPRMLAAMKLLRRRFPDVQAVIPVASTIPRKLIDGMLRGWGQLAVIVEGRSTQALVAADAAVVCSGTATLQTALLARPMVVVYRVSWLSFQILKRLVKVAHIALVNLIAGRRLVPELIQAEFTALNVERELSLLLADSSLRLQVAQELADVRRQLGEPGAAERVAGVAAGYLTSGVPRRAPR